MSGIPMTPQNGRGIGRISPTVARVLPMTTNQSTPDERESVTESTEIEIDALAAEVLAPPEGARVGIKKIRPMDGNDVVSLSLRSENLSGRLLLSPEQAGEIGRELVEKGGEKND